MKNKNKLLAFLLRNARKKYNVNQLARALKISVGSAHKILKDFEKRGIVTAKKLANAIFYKINFENQEARKLCELLLVKDKTRRLKKNKYAKVYSDSLKRLEKLAKVIVLFGSILTKRKKAHDVDALFIANKNKAEQIVDACAEISKSRTKTVNPLIMTPQDFEEKILEKDKVVEGILKEGVVLFGEDKLVGLLR